jgi:hypothetical protein
LNIAPRQPGTWHLAVRGLVHMLVVPQGFTLSVTGTFAITLGHRGFPGPVVIWLFVVAAGLGFCGTTWISGAQREAPGRPVSIAGLAMMNLLPAAVVPAACSASWWISGTSASFLLAGACTSVFYLAGLAAFLVVLHPRPKAPRRGSPAPARPQEEQDGHVCASS